MTNLRRMFPIAIALVSASCSTTPLLVTTPPASMPANGLLATLRPTSSPPSTLEIAGLAFGLPSADAMRAMGDSGNIIVVNGLSLPIRPSFHAPPSSAPQLGNGNFALEASFASSYGDDWGVASVLAAPVPPLGDRDLATYVQATILPVVRAWAADGVLFTKYRYEVDRRTGRPLNQDPDATASEAAIVKNFGWPLAYVSNGQHAAMYIYSSGWILHVRWVQKRYSERTVPVSLQTAIATVVAAMRDPAATCEECRTGRDYYLGVPYKGVFAPNSVNYFDDLVPTFEVPDGIDWQGQFNDEFVDKPTWFVGNSCCGGGGWVDAVTGNLIRFIRMRVAGR